MQALCSINSSLCLDVFYRLTNISWNDLHVKCSSPAILSRYFRSWCQFSLSIAIQFHFFRKFYMYLCCNRKKTQSIVRLLKFSPAHWKCAVKNWSEDSHNVKAIHAHAQEDGYGLGKSIWRKMMMYFCTVVPFDSQVVQIAIGHVKSKPKLCFRLINTVRRCVVIIY